MTEKKNSEQETGDKQDGDERNHAVTMRMRARRSRKFACGETGVKTGTVRGFARTVHSPTHLHNIAVFAAATGKRAHLYVDEIRLDTGKRAVVGHVRAGAKRAPVSWPALTRSVKGKRFSGGGPEWGYGSVMKTFSFGRALLFMAILLSALLLTAPASDAKKLPSPTRVATKKCAKLYKGATARKQCVKRQVKLICHTAKYKKQKACKAYQKPAKKPGGTSTKPGTTDPTTTDPTTTDPANQTWVCDDGTDANVDTDGTIWCSDESTPTLSDGSNDPGTVTVLPCEDGSEPTVDASSGELTCADGSNPGTTALTCADGSLPDVDPDTGDTVCADGSEPS